MSYLVDASGEKLQGQFTSTYDYPITIGCWIQLADYDAVNRYMVNFGNFASTWNDSMAVRNAGTADSMAASNIDTGGSPNSAEHAFTIASSYDGVWLPVIGVFVSDTERHVYYDCVWETGQSNATTATVTETLDHICLGTALEGPGFLMNGEIAQVAIWESQLSDADISLYLGGKSPDEISATNLVGYWPLDADNATQSNLGTDAGGDLTVTNATYSSDEPTIGNYPVVVDRVIGKDDTDGTSHSIPLTGLTITSGQLILILFTADGNPTISWDQSTAGTWSEIWDEAASTSAQCVCYGKVADGTEDTKTLSITTTTSESSSWVVLVIDNWYGGIAGVEAATVTQTSSTPNCPSVTASWGPATNLFIMGLQRDDASTADITDFVESRTMVQTDSTQSANTGTGVCTEIRDAETFDPGSFTTSGSGDSIASTIVIRPFVAPLSNVVQSVERVTIDWDATSEPVTQNLSKSQDETQCVPFFTKRLVSGSLADDWRERTMKVEMINNAGTPAVRVTASGKSDLDDHRIECYVVEFASGINVQQVDADIADTSSSTNIGISDVGNQINAFFLYSYQLTHGSALDSGVDGCIRPVWNGTATNSITIERSGSSGTIDGMLYVVSCENKEFSVQHRDISVVATDELTNDTITAVPLGTSFLLTQFYSDDVGDDPLDWSFVADLSSTTNVRVRRSIAGASNATASVGVQVVTALGGQWSVQRGDFTTTSNLTETTTISAVDQNRAIVKTGTHEAGLNSLGTSDLIASTIIDEVGPAAYLSANNQITWARESVSETGNTIPWEVIQFAAGLDNPILIPTGPLR